MDALSEVAVLDTAAPEQTHSHVTALPVPAVHEAPVDQARQSLEILLHDLIEAGGSDLHLTVNAPPTIRVHGDLGYLPDYDPLTSADTALLVRCVVSDEQWERFERDLELDLAYD
ncbi:MAG TPA: hypothetical protein VIM17_06345, partial [Jatrophihabitantaceae bacterium]